MLPDCQSPRVHFRYPEDWFITVVVAERSQVERWGLTGIRYNKISYLKVSWSSSLLVKSCWSLGRLTLNFPWPSVCKRMSETFLSLAIPGPFLSDFKLLFSNKELFLHVFLATPDGAEPLFQCGPLRLQVCVRSNYGVSWCSSSAQLPSVIFSPTHALTSSLAQL